MCVSTEADVTPAPSIEQPAMISGHGRGRGHVCGHDSYFGGDLAHLEKVMVLMVIGGR